MSIGRFKPEVPENPYKKMQAENRSDPWDQNREIFENAGFSRQMHGFLGGESVGDCNTIPMIASVSSIRELWGSCEGWSIGFEFP